VDSEKRLVHLSGSLKFAAEKADVSKERFKKVFISRIFPN